MRKRTTANQSDQKTTNGETVKIILKLNEIRPDPVQFKPFSPVYNIDNVYVQVDIPKSYVIEDTPERILLTVEGSTWLQIELTKFYEKLMESK